MLTEDEEIRRRRRDQKRRHDQKVEAWLERRMCRQVGGGKIRERGESDPLFRSNTNTHLLTHTHAHAYTHTHTHTHTLARHSLARAHHITKKLYSKLHFVCVLLSVLVIHV